MPLVVKHFNIKCIPLVVKLELEIGHPCFFVGGGGDLFQISYERESTESKIAFQ